jgi:BirA family biotin operon repressor/biotin-[acetyl-CoA-carboxylase] ligase
MSGQRIHLSVVESTNSYTTRLLSQSDIPEWTVITTDHQTAGKGQRGRSWEGDPGLNIMASIVLRPRISVSQQYLISMAVSVAICDVLADFHIHAHVKWPNDILIEERKICGMLIENQLKGDQVETCVVGIGLNVNQRTFSDFDWEGTSMALELGRIIDREEVLHRLIEAIKVRVTQMQQSDQLEFDFKERLFGVGKKILFQGQNDLFEAEVVGVESDGRLILSKDGEEMKFLNGEIKLRRTSS